MKKLLIISLSFVSIGIVFFACHKVAHTNRNQLLLVKSEQMNQMSFQQYTQFLQENKVSSNVSQTQMIKNCGARIKNAVERYLKNKGLSHKLDGFNWEFNLVDDPTVNAWCMPGGKVVFYTGILPICQDETGVAVVMGHEVAHAIAEHGRERMSSQMVLNGLLTLGNLGSQLKSDENSKQKSSLLMQAVGAGSQLGMLAFSRKHESEADHMGLVFMAMAGYDPREAPKFWERMSAGGKASVPEFMSTHPSDKTRINDLNAKMNEALQYYNK